MSQTVIRPCGVAIREQAILVMHYQYGPHDRFNLPGGNLEADETLHDCLIREFQEELHWSITPRELLHVAETRTHRHTLHLIFRIDFQGEPLLDPRHAKATELIWLPASALPTAPLYPAIGPTLAAWLADRPAPVHLGRIPQPWFP
ncbi:MAG: NUDIX domain-containing protein [Magnetococcales bacterium]|nr:NUDIX domain-containing protein [Magnetococcales bacterium]